MTDFRARIGRIRMKTGGADIRIIDRIPHNPRDEDWRGTVVRNARAVGEMATEDAPLVGYLLIGFYGDGASSVGFRWDNERSPIPRALAPAWVAELVRRDLITRPEAEEKFHEIFEWRDGA